MMVIDVVEQLFQFPWTILIVRQIISVRIQSPQADVCIQFLVIQT